MRRFPRSLIVAVSLAMCSVAGQASAGQARPRSAPPANPQSSGSSNPSNPSNDRSRPQAQRRESSPPPQSSRPQASTQQQPRQDTRNNPRAGNAPRGNNNPGNGGINNSQRGNNNPSVGQRGNNGNSNVYNGQYDSRTAPQRQAVPAPRDRYMDLNRNGRDDRYENQNNRYDYRYDNRNNSRGYGYGSSGYGYSGSRIIIAPRRPIRFTRSWFSFRPQLRLSIGLTIGYPIAFPSWYDPYVVGQPGYMAPYMPYGGVSFDVEPRDAELWVDGDYVGRVSDYTSYDPPLTLVAGRHHIALTDGSYRSIEFDITVIAGQVIPYQGTLPYYR